MPTQLLNDDGTASMATAMMSSHHAFRRDLAAFGRSLERGDRGPALLEEWGRFRGALHGHHTIEDTTIFPDLRASQPALAADVDRLGAQHAAIDPLLARGDATFADLTDPAAALAVVRELERLLDEHLELEERVVIPQLRGFKEFPPPPDDAALAMYADGFAWSTAGLAPAVCEALNAMLPAALVERLPAARAAFDERCARVFGAPHRGASTTSVPR